MRPRNRRTGIIRQRQGVRLEYLEIVEPREMQPVERVEGPVVAAGAIWVGTTRLIDNVLCVPPRRIQGAVMRNAASAAIACVVLTMTANGQSAPGSKGITAVPGIRVGHFTLPGGMTGCSVVLADGEGRRRRRVAARRRARHARDRPARSAEPR